MNFIIRKSSVEGASAPTGTASRSRRDFLVKSGIGIASAGVLLAACKDDEDMGTMGGAVNLGSGDLGILNYAYALEQLEAAFYAEVLKGSYFASANADEKSILVDIEAHERTHREFFKAAITSVAPTGIIPGLVVNFSSINFGDRTSVLSTAQAFEDLGVSAYNGAGKLLVNKDYLLVAGKIVSVEARHAAVIRSLVSPNDPKAFAGDDVVNAMGLDMARTPAQVLAIAGTYITTRIDASNLPG